MKKVILVAGVAVLAIASFAGAYTFSSNLTVGSTGADVSALQSWLITNGFSIPSISSGAANTGYFGSQTKAAVVAYQTKNNLPPTGFVGPLTRGLLNGGASMTTTSNPTNCLSGWTAVSYQGSNVCLPPGYTLPGSTTVVPPVVVGSNGTITTPGVPGIMSVTSGPLSSTVLNVGAQMAPVLAIRVQAQYSDIAVQSLNLDLGNNTAAYNKIFKQIYVTSNGVVLASQPLNSSTVIQSGNNYIVGLAGFNVVVPKGTYKDIIIKADLNSSIDSSYLAGGTNYPDGQVGHAAINNTNGAGNIAGWVVGLDAQQLRAVDGAGINLNNAGYLTPTTLTINKSLVDNAQANISVDGSSPTTNSVPVSDTINGNYLGLPVFTFDVYAQNDTLHLHNVAVNVGAVQNGSTGQVTAAYLFQGSTQVQSASVSGGVATFSNITDGTNGATIPVGTTVPFTVKVDVTGVTAGNIAITASTSNSGTTIYNSIDGNVSNVGSAIGNTITVTGNGPSYALNAAPSIVTTGTNSSGQTVSTSSIVASFPISITSTGLDTYFGNTASSTPAFWFNVIDSTGATVYSGNGSSTYAGTVNTANLNNVKVILPTLPTSVTNGVTQANTYKVANQNTVNLGTVQFQFDGKSTSGVVLTGGPYKVNMKQVVSQGSNGTYATTSFMNGLSAWTTATGSNP